MGSWGYWVNDIKHSANLSEKHLGNLVGVAPRTIGRYLVGRNRDENIVERIDIAFEVLAETGLKWPDTRWRGQGETARKTYEKAVKQSEKIDKKFTRAYKKALKKRGL